MLTSLHRVFPILLLVVAWNSSVFGQDEPPALSSVQPISTFQGMVEMLQEDSIPISIDRESQYIVHPNKTAGIDSALVIRWAADDGVVHFIQLIPLEIPPARMNAIETAIVRMNHAYPVPGLGYNHESSAMYFRFTVPLLPRGHLDRNEIKEYFGYVINQATALHPTMSAVATGQITPEQALAFHNARFTEASNPLVGVYELNFNNNLWTLEVNADNTVRLFREADVVVESKISVDENVVTFNDTAGQLKADTPGVYQFEQTDTGLTFKVVEDNSPGRLMILTGGRWVK